MNVQKLSMCRICLVQNVRMFVVANKNLQEVYEKLTDIPLVTEDRRPMLACFLCCNRLKQCYQLQRKCLEAEKMFSRLLNDDYEAKPLLNQGQLEFSGYIISPTEQISISDECPAESGLVINEITPADHEGQDDNIINHNIIVELKEEHQNESEPEFQVIEYLESYSDRKDLLPQLESGEIPPHHSESNSEDEATLMDFKTDEGEKQEVSKQTTKSEPEFQVIEYLESHSDRKDLLPQLESGEILPHHSESNSEDEASLIYFKTDEGGKQKVSKQTTRASGVKKSKPEETVTTQPKKTIRKSHKCDICAHIFSRKGDLNTHMRVHTGEKPFKCDVCLRGFRVKSHLTRHMFEHTGEKPHKCDVCESSFSDMSGLTRHRRQHTGEKPFKCDICQRSFRDRSKLTIHMRVHTGEKPFSCEICQRSFKERGKLTGHMRVHTGEKPFRCDVCQRRFRLKGNLRTHMRVHTGEKPYNCEVCQRSFSDNSTLRHHLLLHTGENPFKCEVCQLRFRYSTYLKKHKLEIH